MQKKKDLFKNIPSCHFLLRVIAIESTLKIRKKAECF